MVKMLAGLLLCFCTPGMYPGVRAAVLSVGEGGEYQSIKEAIARAAVCDTVLVRKGRYTEHSIVLDKPLYVCGENHPVIEPGTEKADVFIVTADQVVIDGFEIANVQVSHLKEFAAIKVKAGRYGSISNNVIRNCFFGIYLEYAKDYLIETNKILGSSVDEARAGNAIHVWKGDRIEISHNTASGHRDGIYFEFVNGSSIHDNQSFDNLRYGLHFMFSNDDEYLRNEFRSNGAGVAVMFSRNIRMLHNRFAENRGGAAYGLLLKEISDGTILRNEFHRNTTAIYAEGANRIVMEQNQFTLNGTALDIKGNCLDNHILENNFLANSFEVVTNTRHNRNKYDNNYWSEYNGYDLDRNGAGDEPHRPVNLFATITNEIPSAAIMMHSPVVGLMALAEQLFPQLIPETLVDKHPRMKPFDHD